MNMEKEHYELWLVDIPDCERDWIKKNTGHDKNISTEIICMDENKAEIMLGEAEKLFEKENESENFSSEEVGKKDFFQKNDKPEIPLSKEKQEIHNNIILISTDQKLLDFAKSKNIPTIGYQPIGSGYFLHADMIAEGFEEVDAVFFQRIYQRHYHIPWTILETKRCIVRELALSDLPELFAMYAEDGMTDYLDPLYDYKEEFEYQKAYIENMYGFYGYGMWLVFEKETGVLIGRVGIEHREETDGVLELGYAIRTGWQRQGYAFEVCQAVLSYAKEELQMEEIHCFIQKENQKSIKLAEKLGFHYEKEQICEEKSVSDFVKILTSQ